MEGGQRTALLRSFFVHPPRVHEWNVPFFFFSLASSQEVMVLSDAWLKEKYVKHNVGFNLGVCATWHKLWSSLVCSSQEPSGWRPFRSCLETLQGDMGGGSVEAWMGETRWGQTRRYTARRPKPQTELISLSLSIYLFDEFPFIRCSVVWCKFLIDTERSFKFLMAMAMRD